MTLIIKIAIGYLAIKAILHVLFTTPTFISRLSFVSNFVFKKNVENTNLDDKKLLQISVLTYDYDTSINDVKLVEENTKKLEKIVSLYKKLEQNLTLMDEEKSFIKELEVRLKSKIWGLIFIDFVYLISSIIFLIVIYKYF